MLLTGTFVRALDDKQRFAIPKCLRDALGPAGTQMLYLAPGTDGSLALYTQATLSTMAQQLGRGSPASQDVRAFSRLFYAQAQPVEMDRQGRIRVPSELAQLAGLGREIVLLGVCDHLEIWDRQRWEEYLARKQPQYDEIAENAFGATTLGTPGTVALATNSLTDATLHDNSLPDSSPPDSSLPDIDRRPPRPR